MERREHSRRRYSSGSDTSEGGRRMEKREKKEKKSKKSKKSKKRHSDRREKHDSSLPLSGLGRERMDVASLQRLGHIREESGSPLTSPLVRTFSGTTPHLRPHNTSSSSISSNSGWGDLEALDVSQMRSILEEMQVLRMDERSFFEDQIESVIGEFTKVTVDKIRLERELNKVRSMLTGEGLLSEDAHTSWKEAFKSWYQLKTLEVEKNVWIVCRQYLLVAYEDDSESNLVGCMLLDKDCTMYHHQPATLGRHGEGNQSEEEEVEDEEEGFEEEMEAVHLVLEHTSLGIAWEVMESSGNTLSDLELSVDENLILSEESMKTPHYVAVRDSLKRLETLKDHKKAFFTQLVAQGVSKTSILSKSANTFIDESFRLCLASIRDLVHHHSGVKTTTVQNRPVRSTSIESAPADGHIEEHRDRATLYKQNQELKARVEALEKEVEWRKEEQEELKEYTASAVRSLETQYKDEVRKMHQEKASL